MQEAQPPAQVGEAAPRCIDIARVEVTGASVLAREMLLEGLPVSGCLGVEELFGFAAAITNRYIEAGYVTTTAFLPEQDLSSGILEIVVVEGRVEAVELFENGVPRRAGLAVMPFMQGRILQLRAIEQGLDQINGLSSRDATISFRPGAEPGWSIVEVAIDAAPGWSVKTGIDNRGSGASGPWQSRTTVVLEDWFGFFETLSLSYKHNLDTDGGRQRAPDATIDLTVPLGNHTVSWSVRASSYLSMIEAAGQTLITSGDTLTHTLALKTLLHRDQTAKTSLRVALRVEDIVNYLNGVRIGVSSRSLSVGSLELLHDDTLLGGSFSGRVGLHQGLPLFGAADNGGPLAIFTRLDADLRHTLPLTPSLALSTSASGQWSPHALYLSEQFSLSSVPGFSGVSMPGMAGENGLRLRGELTYTLPSFGGVADTLLGRLTTFAALETGWTLPGPSNGAATASFTGASFGLRAANGHFYGSASWDIPLSAPGNFSTAGDFRVEAGIALSGF